LVISFKWNVAWAGDAASSGSEVRTSQDSERRRAAGNNARTTGRAAGAGPIDVLLR
jgi:hypothetical protein